MLNRITLVLVAAVIVISPAGAQAQMHGGAAGTVGVGVGVGARGTPGFRGTLHGGAGLHQGHGFRRNSLLLPYPYYYSDYGYDSEPAPPAQVVTVAAPAPASAQGSSTPPLEPLLIEWRGDHFERITLSQKASAGGQNSPDYSEKAAPRTVATGHKAASQPPRDLPPAVLVFRDGRHEEVSSYTIMRGTIYSKADYWTSGSWTRKIQIADLDVPATLKLNQERGLRFVLPGSPNEVIMRP